MTLLIAYAPGITEEMLDALRALGCTLRFLPGEETETYDAPDFSDVEGVVCYRFFCFNDLAHFPALRFIQLTSHGTDHMPPSAPTTRRWICEATKRISRDFATGNVPAFSAILGAMPVLCPVFSLQNALNCIP